MFQNFLGFARTCDIPAQRYVPDEIQGEAIDFFGKRPLYTVLMRIAEVKRYVTANFNGTLVREWTGLQGVLVRITMNEVKGRLGGEEVLSVVSDVSLDSLPSNNIEPGHFTLRTWENTIAGIPVDEIKAMTVRAKEELEVEGKLKRDWRGTKERKAE